MFKKNILCPFIEVVRNYGDNNAFCIDEKFYTYNEFARHISKIRKALKFSNHRSKNIGLVSNDDIEAYASIFSIWFEGFAYFPLHPQQPVERNLEIILQAEIDLVLCSGNNNLFSNVQSIFTSSLEFDELNLMSEPIPEDALAYILFTSGSTGKPKGVPIMRRNIDAFMKSFSEVGFKINHSDTYD
jgi:D-alanine--poly(phosphoribitol) ligase subunit 1